MRGPNFKLGPGSLVTRLPLETREAPAFDWRELVVVAAIIALLLLGMAILCEVRGLRADLEPGPGPGGMEYGSDGVLGKANTPVLHHSTTGAGHRGQECPRYGARAVAARGAK